MHEHPAQLSAAGADPAEPTGLGPRLRHAIDLLPSVRERPEQLRAWLLGARRAQLTFAAMVLLGLFVMPPLREVLVQAVYPSKVSGGFLGLGKRKRKDPRGDALRTGIGLVYWLSTAGTSAALLLLHLPEVAAAGAAAAAGRSTRREQDRAGAEASGGSVAAASVVGGASAAGVSATDATFISQDGTAAPVVDGAGATLAGAATTSAATTGSRYVVEAELGAGGMGVVHRAHDSMLGRKVALKRLFPELALNRELSARFLREARVLAQLAHPHIVQVFDVGQDPQGMWMAMELLESGSLDGVLEQGALPFERTLELGRQLAEALAYAHGRGVVHRDFKPPNVLMYGPRHVKVTDFGLAKLMQEGGDTKLTRPGAVMGSPAYMSPEQATAAEVDARSDIYSLGVTLFEMCSGAVPFEGETPQVLMKHLTATPELADEVRAALPPDFVALMLRMLEKRPEDRPQTMDEVVSALRAMG
ncbi:MAG: serine/threonine protein kinase [Myxococcales bacterium]|nr:serine/threonine protein kinase [Myxococcales bacterium]